MRLLIVTLATIFTFTGFCESCSPAEGHKWKSIAELTKLAPLVLHAKVVATANRTIHQWEYNATLNVIQVYKGKLNETLIVVAGFANSASCQSDVFVGDEKIFFLDVGPFRARYDDISSAVATNSSETFQGILEGLCCPYTSDCPRPKFTCRGCTTAVTSTWFFIIMLGSTKLFVGW
ncbi:Tumor necrosis factor-inducible gene 6 [Paramuricea clavata]|uniref:Tumor necrosis factor-inducible gene 6 n=1 Tax=Paramuricea clavata TaxID=317549 RepID=A0A7D9JAM9_PARCT|nr:Tumor necrosis factor-inducible gene 6 [Paramuricea clavata]